MHVLQHVNWLDTHIRIRFINAAGTVGGGDPTIFRDQVKPSLKNTCREHFVGALRYKPEGRGFDSRGI
jgi:hypothetical protein